VGKVWNGTANQIHDAGGKLTGYEGAWVHADADVQPAFAGVEPQKKPAYRPPTGKVWNGTANAMRNTSGVVTSYAGAWVREALPLLSSTSPTPSTFLPPSPSLYVF
jgi:hypothetical protein